MASIGFDTNGNLKINGSARAFGGHTAYNLISGSLALAGSTIKSGFATTLYTGNGTTQSVVTGVDMATQWGNSASETYGGLVWIKGRSGATNNFLYDTIRGVTKEINTNTADAEATLANSLTAFSSTGFSVGSDAGHNTNTATYASWVFQTTHRITGTTNHGKAYTCHYNPYTGFTMVKYEGSGIAGHEIPHHLGRKLGFVTVKNLTNTTSWVGAYNSIDGHIKINETAAFSTIHLFSSNIDNVTVDYLADSAVNASANQYILYGWANSYFDEANTLIGNYEIGVYQGTGAAGNKVTTRGKPAWVMIKRLDVASDWWISDVVRTPSQILGANLANAEQTAVVGTFDDNGFNINSTLAGHNASGGQYLYMVVYDNDSGSGKSKYPKASDTTNLNINATIPFANGLDSNGTKNSILTKSETISGLTLQQGKNYVYAKNDGTYGVSYVSPTYSNVNPANGGDFYNITENKWYTSAGVEITESRNYLNAIVYADQNGQPTYVEQLPKTNYFDEVKANEFKGKNACTAWVLCNGNTTPVTIYASYNVKTVIRTATGKFRLYFETPMDNTNYLDVGRTGTFEGSGSMYLGSYKDVKFKTVDGFDFASFGDNGTYATALDIAIQVYGGKN